MARVVEAVEAEGDVSAERIMGRRSDAETVEARWVCARLLRDEGYYPSRIAELLGVTPRYVQYILTDFDDRVAMCAMMRTTYERARKRIGKATEKDM